MVLKAEAWTDTCITIFIAAFFTIAQKVDATQMFTYEWMNKQNVVYTYK